MSKGISHLFKTEKGRKELDRLIKTNLPKILEKREREGFYSTDIINYNLKK